MHHAILYACSERSPQMLFTCAITLLGHPLSSRCLPAVGVAPSTTGGVPTILLRGAPSDALHIIYSIHVLCTVSWMWFTGCTEVGVPPPVIPVGGDVVYLYLSWDCLGNVWRCAIQSCRLPILYGYTFCQQEPQNNPKGEGFPGRGLNTSLGICSGSCWHFGRVHPYTRLNLEFSLGT